MSRTVDYRSVIGRLTDAIKELNGPHAAPKDPKKSAKRVAEERRRDAAKLLRALLRALEQNPAASAAAGAAAAAAAAAERSAGALRGSEATPEQQSLAFWAWMGEAERDGTPDPAEFYEYADAYGFDRRNAKTLYSIFYPSGEDGKCVVKRADLLYSVQGLLGALDAANAALATSQRERDAANTALEESQAALRKVAEWLARVLLGYPHIFPHHLNVYTALVASLMGETRINDNLHVLLNRVVSDGSGLRFKDFVSDTIIPQWF